MGVKLPPFQRLVDAYWTDVARLAHALAGPVHGDDVAQQAWTKAVASYPRLTSAANLRSWLMTITARCAMDSFRASALQPVPVPDLAVFDREGAAGAVPIVAENAGDPLWVAVRCLPDRQRTAIALRYIADLDHAQIAAFLDVTPAASRRLVSDSLCALRIRLAHDPELHPLTSTQEDRP